MQSDADFDAVLSVSRVDDARFTLEIPGSWVQGKGAFGGLVLGACAQAIEAAEPEQDRILRTLSGEIPAPVVPGRATIEVEVVRRGSAMTTVRAVMHQDGAPVAIVSAVSGRARRDAAGRSLSKDEVVRQAPPTMPDWRAIPAAPIGPPIAPRFTQHFDIRVTGPLPFSSASDATAEGFVRPKVGQRPWGGPELVALADVFWPAALALEPAPRPMGTVSFFLQRFGDGQPLASGAPLFYRARTLGANDGFVAEERQLWTTPDRGPVELVAHNVQTFVWIK